MEEKDKYSKIWRARENEAVGQVSMKTASLLVAIPSSFLHTVNI